MKFLIKYKRTQICLSTLDALECSEPTDFWHRRFILILGQSIFFARTAFFNPQTIYIYSLTLAFYISIGGGGIMSSCRRNILTLKNSALMPILKYTVRFRITSWVNLTMSVQVNVVIKQQVAIFLLFGYKDELMEIGHSRDKCPLWNPVLRG